MKTRHYVPRFHCAIEPGSVPRPRADEQSYIWDECCHSPQAALLSPRVVMTSTALHTGRNLAVAPGTFPFRLTSCEVSSLLSLDVSVRIPVFADDGCYPLPCSILRWVCPDFPPSTFARLLCHIAIGVLESILPHTNKRRKKVLGDCFAQTPILTYLQKI